MRRVILSIRILINSFYLDFKFKFIQPAHCYTHKYIFKTFLNFEPIPVSITWDELNEKKTRFLSTNRKKKDLECWLFGFTCWRAYSVDLNKNGICVWELVRKRERERDIETIVNAFQNMGEVVCCCCIVSVIVVLVKVCLLHAY